MRRWISGSLLCDIIIVLLISYAIVFRERFDGTWAVNEYSVVILFFLLICVTDIILWRNKWRRRHGCNYITEFKWEMGVD